MKGTSRKGGFSTNTPRHTRDYSFANAVWLCLAGAIIVLSFAAFYLSPQPSVESMPAPTFSCHNSAQAVLNLDPQIGRSLLHQGIPLLSRHTGEDDPKWNHYFRPVDFFLRLVSDIRYPSPQEFLCAQIPLLDRKVRFDLQQDSAQVQPVMARPVTNRAVPVPIPAEPRLIRERSTEPQVLVFHTHTSESYLPVSGVDHKHNKKGDIVKAGRFLAEQLEISGIPTLYTDEIHDMYPFRDSYKRSQETISRLLQENPSIRMVLDIHRDGTTGISCRKVIAGRQAAGIVLVVGTDRMGLTHPHWQTNHKFALALADATDRRFPGLVLRVIQSDARYNQHLHNNAIIVELGNQYSTMDEAKNSVVYLAEVIAEYLRNNPEHLRPLQGRLSPEDSLPALGGAGQNDIIL